MDESSGTKSHEKSLNVRFKNSFKKNNDFYLKK